MKNRSTHLKRAIALIFTSLCFVVTSVAQDGWSLIETNSMPVYDMHVVEGATANTTHIFTVGAVGTIRKSTNGGFTWTSQVSGTTSNLTDISVYDYNDAWVVGGTNQILRTTNGGTTWSSTTVAGAPGFYGIHMTSLNGYGWAVGSGGSIYRTTNGGTTWTAQTSNTTNILTAVYAFDTQIVIAVGSNGTICRTTNGGATWTVSTVGSIVLNDVTSVAVNALYAVGTGGTILKSTNTGVSWVAQTSGTTNELNSVTGSGSIVYAAGVNGTIVKTTNGSASAWSVLATGRTDEINTIGLRSYISPNTTNEVWASTNHAFMRTINGGTGCTTPSVTMLSTNIVACVGDNVTISSNAVGTVGTRMWKKNGTGLSLGNSGGGTNAHAQQLQLNNIQASAAGTYLVEVTSPCGTSTSASITVTVNDTPSQIFAISGGAFPTQTIQNVYSVNPIAGLNYVWDGGSGATVTGSGNSVNIAWSSTGARTVSVTPSNSCGLGTASTKNVTVQTPLGAPTFSPLNNSTNVPVSNNLTLTFATALTLIDGETITIKRSSDNSIFASYTLPSGNVTVSSNVVTINPSTNFESNTAYYVQIEPGAIYNQLSPFNAYLGITNTTSWSFTTADATPPTIANYSPAISATNVPVGSNLVATFSENVFAVATKVIGIQRVSNGMVFATYTLPSPNVTISGNTVTINPSSDLMPSTAYYVNFPNGVFEDAAGNDFSGGTSWTFTTGAAIDGTPPGISILSPLDNAIGVGVTSNLTATFSETIFGVVSKVVTVKRTLDNTIFESYTLPSGNVIVSGNTVVINPTAILANSTGYYINIEAGAFEDAAGNDFAGITNNSVWNFTTLDTSPPTVVSFSPTDNSTGVAVNSNLVITFSEDVNPVATKIIRTYRLADNEPLETITLPDARVMISGSTVTINPSIDFLASTEYSVIVETGAFEDAAGNDIAPIFGSLWNFTTAAPTDAIPPTVMTFAPVDDATNVSVSSNFVITFSENVVAGSSKSVIIRRLSDGNPFENYVLPNANVTVLGNTVTINPSGTLVNSSGYYITIEPGALEDLAGNDFAGFADNATWNFTTEATALQNQTITFNTLAAKTFGDAPFALAATASSGLSVSYTSSNTAVATVSGSTVIIVGAGTTTITALQAGNGSFNPAPSVQQTLTVNKANQTITFGALTAKTFGDVNFSLGATASSALGVSYTSSNPAVATISGNTVTIVGAGSTIITASQAGNTNYNAASDVQQTLTVNKANQTIVFSALAAKTFGDANFSLGATASSALGVSYTSSNPAVATVSGNTVTIVGAGSTIITASQAGNANYNAAADVQQTLTVNKANQSITFGVLAAKTFSDPNFSLGATASSALGVSYTSSNPAVATVSGNTVTIVGAGSTNITASQAGNVNYNAATNVQQTLTVNKANQTITFNALPGKQVGDVAFGLTATASSGLALSYTSSNTAVATISGSTVTIVGAGSTTIMASQTGNTNFNAAASVQQTLTVTNAAPAMAIQSLTPVNNATEVDGSINLSITFNQNVDIGTGTISILRSDNDALVTSLSNFSGAITISGATATFNFPVNLPAGAGVYVNISAGYLRSAADASNTFPGISNKTTWNFAVGKLDQTITFNSVAAKTFGNSNFDLTATASSGLPITYSSSNTSVATISGSTVTIVGAGSTTITASQSGNSTFNAATNVQQLLTVNKANQTISFSALAAKTFGDPNFVLSAISSSGLGVTYSSSNTSVATVSGNTVTILGAGSTILTASQSGNANFNAATNVQQVLTVNKANQTISFSALAAKTFGDANFSVGATASSGLPVTFTSSNTSIATVSGNTITLVGAGSTVITASQAGNGNFNAAANAQQTLVVNKADQTITFSPLAAKTFGDASFTLSASASSALTVTYSSNNPSVATVSGNTVTIVGAGSTTITASQGGNANINSAPIVQQTLTVNKANQTISFTAIPAKQVGDPAFTLSATSSSGLPITFTSSNTAVATVSGSSVTIVGAGSSTITASQVGNANYNAASAERVLTVSNPTLQNQTITFNALPTKTFGDAAFTISASASSGLPVTFGSSNTSVATVVGNTVTIVGAGVATITAQQSGNSTFNAAPVVQQTLTVNKAAQTLSFAALPVKTFGDASFTLSATSSSALPVSFSSSNTAVATVSGNTVTIVGAGSTIISASQGGDANYNAATAVNQSLTVNKATQTITFGSLVAKNVSDPPFSLNATASSGLAVAYTSSNVSVATVSGNSVTIVGQGTTTITASQSGNSNYSAASNVSQTLTVSANTTTRVISLSGDMTFGNVIIPNTLVRPLTISNAGNSSLEITQISVPARYSVDITTGTIAPGNTLVVNITFAPDAPKSYDGVIAITSNATAGISQITVNGIGALVTAIEDDPAFRKSISVYPNPGKDVFMIEAPSLTSLHSIIVDGAGRVVLEVDLFEKSLGNYELNLLELNQGLYYIQLTTDSGIKTIRILKL